MAPVSDAGDGKNRNAQGDTTAPTTALYDDVNSTRQQQRTGTGSGSGSGADNGPGAGTDGEGKDGKDKDGGILHIDWKKIFGDMDEDPQPNTEKPNPDAVDAFNKLKEEVRKRIAEGIKGEFEKKPQSKEDPWGGKSPAESITASAINQGGNPDCFFESALASLANTKKGKEMIEKMITANDDGSFTIKFPGADNAVTVTKQDIADSGTTNNEPWSRAMEAAFLKYNAQDWHGNPITDGLGAFLDVRTMNDAVRLLTGNQVATTQFAFTDLGSGKLSLGSISEDNVENQLKWAMEHDAVVTAGASPSFAKWVGGNDPGVIPDQHAYSVLAYDEKTKTVTVRNPWGSNPKPLDKEGDTANGITNAGDGKLTMSLDTFYHTFSDMSVEGRSDLYNTVENTITDAINVPKNITEAGWDLLHGDLKGTGAHLVHAFDSFMHGQQNGLNGASHLFFDYLGYAAKHPLLNFIPGATPIAFTVDQAKQALPLVVDKVEDLGESVVEVGKDVVDVGKDVVSTGTSIVTAPIKGLGKVFGIG